MDMYDRQGNSISVDEWGTLHSDINYKRIGWRDFEGSVSVSTVWLGIDHAMPWDDQPLIFETMVFGGPYADAQMRYATEQEAIDGHARTCSDIEAGRQPWFENEEAG